MRMTREAAGRKSRDADEKGQALDSHEVPLRPGARPPLVLTAELPPALHGRVEALRRMHYPAERNHVPAHVTLLRALPPFVEEEARDLLARLAAELQPPPARVTGIMDLGSGTAIAIESDALLAMRGLIAAHFHGMLTQQDEGLPRLHATVQNKVLRAEARALQSALEPAIRPEPFAFTALALHRYYGGPWEPAGRWPFRGRARR